MSSVFVKQNKELAGVKLLSAQKAFVFDKKTGRKDKLNPDYDFVGKIDMDIPNFVIKANKRLQKTAFVDDVSELPKRVKAEVVDYFFDDKGERNRRSKVYLVRTDRNSKTKYELKKELKSKRKGNLRK